MSKEIRAELKKQFESDLRGYFDVTTETDEAGWFYTNIKTSNMFSSYSRGYCHAMLDSEQQIHDLLVALKGLASVARVAKNEDMAYMNKAIELIAKAESC